jgi:CRP/FNR family transcriptional regulator, cyclic AMP receptor protein
VSIKAGTRFKHDIVENFKDGDCIFKEGDYGRDLYVVQKGMVRITKKIGNEELEIINFERGDFFGDIGLLQNIPRYASAFAKGEVRLLILRPAGFLLKIRRDPTFAFEMLQQLSLRIKVSNDRMVSLAQKFNLAPKEIQQILNDINGKA